MNPTDPALEVDQAGWCRQARHCPSPNFESRPAGAEIDLLVVHNISLPPDEFGEHYIEDLFLNRLDCAAHPYFERLRGMRVSAHFLIRRDGELLQFVSANDRAWHAGLSRFRERERCNEFSIGVELEGSDFQIFEPIQYEVLARLVAALSLRYPLRHITGHEHIAPGRKTDPGPCFDWQRLSQLIPTHPHLPDAAV
jgi:AmpD protein